jgi:hypothetical protein
MSFVKKDFAKLYKTDLVYTFYKVNIVLFYLNSYFTTVTYFLLNADLVLIKHYKHYELMLFNIQNNTNYIL